MKELSSSTRDSRIERLNVRRTGVVTAFYRNTLSSGLTGTTGYMTGSVSSVAGSHGHGYGWRRSTLKILVEVYAFIFHVALNFFIPLELEEFDQVRKFFGLFP